MHSCLGFARFNFALRTCSPALIVNAIAAFDKAMLDIMEVIWNRSFSESQRELAGKLFAVCAFEVLPETESVFKRIHRGSGISERWNISYSAAQTYQRVYQHKPISGSISAFRSRSEGLLPLVVADSFDIFCQKFIQLMTPELQRIHALCRFPKWFKRSLTLTYRWFRVAFGV